MKKLIVGSSVLALILTGFCVAVGIDIALQGALVTDRIERFPELWLSSPSSRSP